MAMDQRPLAVSMGEPAGIGPDLIVHAAKTRNLRAGTIIGSGTVSSEGNVGCIAELRARESLEEGAGGKPRTGYMKFDDRVRIDAFDTHGTSMFGAIDQQVASLRRRRAASAAAEAAAEQAAAAADPGSADNQAPPASPGA
jgi:4-hydroxy-L-threonine phosphate dehydrogenase PdxA